MKVNNTFNYIKVDPKINDLFDTCYSGIHFLFFILSLFGKIFFYYI